ncbi:MAG: hypothetical protein AAF367_14255 [Pseudomonadota bacterium]
MDTPLSDAETASRIVDEAQRLYHDLARELNQALTKLRNGIDDPEAKSRAETIRAHRKALQTILDIQAKFVTQAEEGSSGYELDLEAARREINRRLDRLAALKRD